MAPNTQQRQRLLVVVALTCVGLFIADRLLFRPYIRAFGDRIERIGELRNRLERGQLLLARAQTLEERWQQMQRESLPADRSQAEGLVFSAMNRWRSTSGVTFTSLTSNWRETDKRYNLFEWRITAVGTLSQLVRFLNAVEVDPIAAKIEEAQLMAEDEQGSRLRLSATITFLQLQAGQQKQTTNQRAGLNEEV